MSSETTELADDRLFVFSNSYELDGRVTSHPVQARGFAPMQTYLVKEGEQALLIGTGLTIHEERLIEQIDAALGSASLSLMPLGVDFARICNARPIADRFSVDRVFEPTNRGDIPGMWLNIRPEFPAGVGDSLQVAATEVLRIGRPIRVDRDGGRTLELLVPPLRLLPTQWVYDEVTRTLFTLDVFSWVWHREDAGPWTVTEAVDDSTTAERVRNQLLTNRYWWLAGADTSRIRRELADVFDRYDVQNIAPDCGCVLSGGTVVARHYQLLDDVLAAAPRAPAVGVEVGRWRFAER